MPTQSPHSKACSQTVVKLQWGLCQDPGGLAAGDSLSGHVGVLQCCSKHHRRVEYLLQHWMQNKLRTFYLENCLLTKSAIRFEKSASTTLKRKMCLVVCENFDSVVGRFLWRPNGQKVYIFPSYWNKLDTCILSAMWFHSI